MPGNKKPDDSGWGIIGRKDGALERRPRRMPRARLLESPMMKNVHVEFVYTGLRAGGKGIFVFAIRLPWARRRHRFP